jgi:hypothetical protein
LKKPILKQWECEEKEKFLQGFPKNFVKKKTEMDALKDAIKEVEVSKIHKCVVLLFPHQVTFIV